MAYLFPKKKRLIVISASLVTNQLFKTKDKIWNFLKMILFVNNMISFK